MRLVVGANIGGGHIGGRRERKRVMEREATPTVVAGGGGGGRWSSDRIGHWRLSVGVRSGCGLQGLV